MPIKRFQLSDTASVPREKERLVFEWSEIIQSIILNCDLVRLVFTMQSNCSCS